MGAVAARELRNHTADVIKRVQAGEDITLTNRGEEIAQIIPIDRGRKDYLTPTEVMAFPKMDLDSAHALMKIGEEDTDNLEGAL